MYGLLDNFFVSLPFRKFSLRFRGFPMRALSGLIRGRRIHWATPPISLNRTLVRCDKQQRAGNKQDRGHANTKEKCRFRLVWKFKYSYSK